MLERVNEWKWRRRKKFDKDKRKVRKRQVNEGIDINMEK